MADAHAQVGAQEMHRFTSVARLAQVHLPAGMSVTEALARYQGRPDVESARPNFMRHLEAAPNDPYFRQGFLWALQNTGQGGGTAGVDINATAAGNLTTGSRAVVVMEIDSGIDYTHQDLAANMWSAPSSFNVTIGGSKITCAAGTHGFNVLTMTCDPMDDNNHGSHVSGTIGATGNNGVGVVGVNWTTRIMALKFLDSSGSGTIANGSWRLRITWLSTSISIIAPSPTRQIVMSAGRRATDRVSSRRIAGRIRR